MNRSYGTGFASRIAIAMSCALLVAGCANSGASDAREACSVPAVASSAGFNPDTEPLSRLVASADVAQQRATLAGKAAEADARWTVLAEASFTLSAFADLLVETRMNGEEVSAVTTPDMWDQLKFASDAFLAECRAAMK